MNILIISKNIGMSICLLSFTMCLSRGLSLKFFQSCSIHNIVHWTRKNMDRQTVMRQKSTRLFVCAFVVMAPVHRACFLVFLLCQEDKEMYDSCILLRIPLTTHFLSSSPLINSWGKHSRHNWVIFQSCKIMVDSTVVGSNPNVSNISKSSNHTHYSKSQIFLQKFNFDKTPTFSPKKFFDNFSREVVKS